MGGALPYFASRGLRFGNQVIFTYGPLGYLTGYAYVDYLSSQRVFWEFAIKAGFVILFCTLLRSLSIWRALALAVSIILFLGNYVRSVRFCNRVGGIASVWSRQR